MNAMDERHIDEAVQVESNERRGLQECLVMLWGLFYVNVGVALTVSGVDL